MSLNSALPNGQSPSLKDALFTISQEAMIAVSTLADLTGHCRAGKVIRVLGSWLGRLKNGMLRADESNSSLGYGSQEAEAEAQTGDDSGPQMEEYELYYSSDKEVVQAQRLRRVRRSQQAEQGPKRGANDAVRAHYSRRAQQI